MNKYILIIFFVMITLLTGCNEESVPEPGKSTKTEKIANHVDNTKGYSIKNATPINFKVGEQEFHIVPVFNPMLEYIQKVEENSEEKHKELYLSTVVEPFRKNVFGENGGLWLKDRYSFAAPINIERLNESIQMLDEDYEHFSYLIKEALKKSSNLLPSGNTTIYLFPFNPDQYHFISQMSGVMAFASSNQIIILQIAPQKYNEETLKYAMAHEYHHVAYFEKNENQNKDLVDYILTEGKADSFAKLIIPDFEAPWTKGLSPDEEQAIWNWAKERRYSFNEKDLAEMRGGNGDIPQWSNYKIGYQIMQEFLKNNPDVSIEQWTSMDSDEILEKSNFNDK